MLRILEEPSSFRVISEKESKQASEQQTRRHPGKTCPKSNDSKSTIQDEEVLLKDVLRSSNEAHVYAGILERACGEESPLVFGWRKVHEFVEAIAAANAQADAGGAAVPPPPFPLPDPLTTESFKKALLAHAQSRSAGLLGTSCLSGHLGDTCCAVAELGQLNATPWVKHVISLGGADKVLPVVDLFTPKEDNEDLLEIAITPRPNALWNAA